MANTIGYTEPRLVGSGNLKEPKIFLGQALQGAAWRRGDILISSTTGTITAPPAGSGSLAALIPGTSTTSAVTFGSASTSGAAATTYYIAVTYTGSSTESAPSQTYVVNSPAGHTPTVTVASAGAPAAATGWNAYIGITPGGLSLENAAPTSLGSAYTVTSPLTNNIGWNRAATNPSSGIVGLALNASNENFFDGSGGSFNVGPGSRLGANTGIPPLAPFEAQGFYVAGLGQGQLLEMNLINTTAWYPSLLGTTAGLALDATTGFFIVDPGQTNKIITITDKRDGVYIGPTAQGGTGDLGVRIIVQFNSGLALS